MIPRREIEYFLPKGIFNYREAQAACAKTGHTIAVIPTKKHWIEALDLFQKTYGADKKPIKDYNYFWIGISHALGDKPMWDDRETEVTYNEFKLSGARGNFIVMSKVDGHWESAPQSVRHRVMCSKYV